MAKANIELNSQESFSKPVKANKSHANFGLIYQINLKLALKSSGVLSVMIIHILLAALMLILETVLGLGNNSLLQVYRGMFYIFSSTTTIILVMVQAIYLFKKQIKDGIHSIELRAGFKTEKSFFIRMLVMLTINAVANGFVLVVVGLLHVFRFTTTELMLAFGYSQVFFLFYLSIIGTLIVTFLFMIAKAMMAVMLTTIFMFVVSLSPFFASIKYLFIFENQSTNYGIKLKTLDDYTSSITSIKSDEVKKIYEDKLVNDQSELVVNFQNNFQGFEIPSYLQGKIAHPIFDTSFPHSIGGGNLNFEMINENKLVKTFNSGQWNYDFSKFESAEGGINVGGTYFDNTPLKPVLESVFEKTSELYKDTNGSANANLMPRLLMYKSSWVTGINDIFVSMDISEYIKQMSEALPEYADYFKTLELVYNRYEKLWNVEDNKNEIFSDLYKYNWSTSRDYNTADFFTPNLTAEYPIEANSASLDPCTTINNSDPTIFDFTCTPNKQIDEENTAKAEIYQKVPELSILNYLIINFWMNSFNLNVNVDIGSPSPLEDVYNYFLESNVGKTLTLDIFRHFGVMSSGLFANPMYNDIYTSSGGAIIYQGRIVYIEDIFKYEKDFTTKQTAYQLQKPFLQDRTITYKKSFILPLAYVVYLLIAAPLGYLSYLIYNRKSKI